MKELIFIIMKQASWFLQQIIIWREAFVAAMDAGIALINMKMYRNPNEVNFC